MLITVTVSYGQFHIGFDAIKEDITKNELNEKNNLKSADAVRYQLDSTYTSTWVDSMQLWLMSSKSLYSYNTDGIWLEQINMRWVDSTMIWVNSSRVVDILLDDYGNYLNYKYDFWESDSMFWFDYFKIISIVDGNGKVVQEDLYFAFNDSFNLVYDSKGIYTYDEKGNISQYVESYYNVTDSTWLDYYKVSDYAYNENNDKIFQISYRWDFTVSDWKEFRKTELSYDNKFNLLISTLQQYDDSTGWYNYEKREYKYDDNGNKIEYYNYRWNNDISQWYKRLKTDYFYGAVEYVGINIHHFDENKKLKVFPNPANSFINFEIEGQVQPVIVDIYDWSGRSILKQDITTNQQVSIKHLKRGMYFYSLNKNGQKQNGKIIIK